MYHLGLQPERVQEKKYGYYFPDVEQDDIGMRRVPTPSQTLRPRPRPQAFAAKTLDIGDALSSSIVAPAVPTQVV